MIDSLEDPYSNYLDLDDTSDFNETINGSFVGIGVAVNYGKEYSTIVEVYDNSPASKAGLEVGDTIIKVDGNDVKNKVGDELTSLIRGKKGTKFSITVLRGEKEIDFEVTRDVIEIENVDSYVIKSGKNKIGYIYVSTFASNTYSQFYNALSKLEKDDITSLIIDVRGNPGGQLLPTRQILSLFFNKKTVLYQIQSKNSTEKAYSYSNTVRKYPIAILVNKGSASASEVLASCFQDNYKKAKLVGTTTYGKGTVQKSQSLKSGTTIKYTTDKWLTAKGNWIHEKGLVPDIEVEQSEEYYKNPTDENDKVLQEAIKYLKESTK